MRHVYSTGLALLWAACAAAAADAPRIAWQEWALEAFQQAGAQDKMILVDVGIEGCTACRWMDEDTYRHPRVVELINEHFVAIGVDAEARPDVGERYSDWAWPATIFMSPDATQVLALRGNRRPRNFIPILQELIDKKAEGRLQADRLAPYAAPPEPEETELTKLRDRVRLQIDRYLDRDRGGWQQHAFSTATGSRLQHLYWRAHLYRSEELEALALKTTDRYLEAIDPVWGGVFVVTFPEDGKVPERFDRLAAVPEKRISNQADAMSAFAAAYHLTGRQVYRDAIADIDRFLRNWMTAEDGTFYTSQEDDPPKLPAGMSSTDYWLLDSDGARREYGIPPIDHAVYTDKNGQLIEAYATAFEATGDGAYLAAAVRAAEALLERRMQADGWIKQAHSAAILAGDQRMRPHVAEDTPFLSAQSWFGTALLALYRATGEGRWLGHARRIADQMLVQLYDHDRGGFFAAPARDTSKVVPRRKPLEHNATAARFFYDIWVYSKDARYAEIPEQAIRAVAVPPVLKREGKMTGQSALALEKLTAAYVEFSVVGDPADPGAQALYAAGRAAYHPRKLLHFEQAGRYPARAKPAMYICNPDRCSLPIEDPAAVARQADSFRGPASTSRLFGGPG